MTAPFEAGFRAKFEPRGDGLLYRTPAGGVIYSRAEVDETIAKALAAGGSVFEEAEDHGFMYAHSFIDPDGHGWNLIHMAETA